MTEEEEEKEKEEEVEEEEEEEKEEEGGDLTLPGSRSVPGHSTRDLSMLKISLQFS